MKFIFRCLGGSFFRTIGRILAYFFISFLLFYLLKKTGLVGVII